MKEIRDTSYEDDFRRMKNVELVIAYKDKVFNIGSNYTISEIDSVYVCGAGADTAYGSLYTSQYLGVLPEERIMLAIKAAGHRNHSVSTEVFIGDTDGNPFIEYGKTKNDKI